MKKLVYIICALVLVGCEKTIPLDAETKVPKLVVNCTFNPDSTWDVYLTKSQSVLDIADYKGIEGADVKITEENGGTISLIDEGDGYYSFASAPLPNKTYNIDVSASGFKSVYAQDIVPDLGTISNVDTSSTYKFNEQFLKVNFTISDPLGDNYYAVSCHIVDTSFGQTYEYDMYFTFGSSEFDNYDPEAYVQRAFLKDDSFDGSSFEASLLLPYYPFESGNSSKIDMTIYSCSEAAYKHLVSYDKYLQSVYDPFAQPVQVYSNVTNGFGIFAGSQTYTYVLKN